MEEMEDVSSFSACYMEPLGRPMRLSGEMREWPLLKPPGPLALLVAVTGAENVAALHFTYSVCVQQASHEIQHITMSELCRLARNPGDQEAWYLQWRALPHPRGAEGEQDRDDDGVRTEITANGMENEASLTGTAVERLVQLVRRPSTVAKSALCEVNAWIGCSRTSHLHFDGKDNWLAVALGEKEVHLYSPSQLSSLYAQLEPSERWKSGARSRLYLSEDGTDYPLLRRAPFLKVMLRAGEMLYIPAGWFHEVLTPTFTIAFNFWFTPHPRHKFRPTILYLHSDLYARRISEEARRLEAECAQDSDEGSQGSNEPHGPLGEAQAEGADCSRKRSREQPRGS